MRSTVAAVAAARRPPARTERRAVLRLLALAAVSVLPLAASACTIGGRAAGGLPVQVVTSLGLFADFVRQVGGDRVAVTSLVPSGADPHTYEPSPRQVAKVERARLAVVNGLDADRTIANLIRANTSTLVLQLVDSVPPSAIIEDNPHLWMNPQYAVLYVRALQRALTEVDPDGAADYLRNADAYVAQVQALDREVESKLSVIPPERRRLVTFHDAFPYLAQRYGFEVVGVVLKGPGREPNASEIADLTKVLESGGVPAAFKEPQFNARVLELAAADAGVKVLDVYTDAFGNGVQSYLDLMRFDTAQLVAGLA